MKEKLTPNKQLFSKSLLSLASSDLESCRVLFLNGLYHNALFSLQQSVEKLVKAIGLETGIIRLDKIKRIGHEPHRVFKEAVDQTAKDLLTLDQNPELKNMLTSEEGFNDYNTMVQDSSIFFRDQHKYDFKYLDEEEVIEILNHLEYSSQNLEKQEIDSEKYKDLLVKLFATIPELNDSDHEIKTFLEKLVVGANIDLDLLPVNNILLWLSLITQKHQDKARYPCECCGDSPIIYYDLELPLIKYLGNFHNLQLFCLQKYSEIRLDLKAFLSSSEEE